MSTSSPIPSLNAALSGRYRVERELGEGGMATVYLAHDLRHERRVALKVLKPELAAAVGVERFLAEIRTTANLRHPHILPLFDSGEAGGFLFYVMPYVEGDSLRVRLAREGTPSLDEALRFAREVAAALDHAHRQGVVHRDVKPANVLLLDGEAVLADFGIALGLDEEDRGRLTRVGASLGTPGYMSPEQAAGDRTLTSRSDIYSLGALLFEMLAGKPPFAGETPRAALARALTEDAPDVRTYRSDVDAATAEAIACALSREPAARPASAAAFADSLAPSPAESGGGRGGGRGWWAAAVATVIAVTASGLWYRASRESRWARVEALPEIERLLSADAQAEAFALAERAVEVLPDDPVLLGLYEAASVEVALTSEPAGATVSYRTYDRKDSEWREIGITPLAAVRLPNEELLVRFELNGHHPFGASFMSAFASLHGRLRPLDRPAEVILAGSYAMTGEAVLLDTFWIDTHEVTNAEYREFVEAVDFGSSDYWRMPFEELGVGVDSARMEAAFVDATGRPGPAGWELSRHAEGRGDHPVGGVSWFEAVAYCAFRGKRLPTYYHWKFADAGEVSPSDGALRHGNIGGSEGPVPVGSSESLSARGTSDMIGNVREWVWNASRGERYVLGGSWASPAHLYTDYDAADPWSRDEGNGVRCARYDVSQGDAIAQPIETPIFDFNGFEPVDDATYATYASFYRYDPIELGEHRVVVSETEDWVREYVEFDAAYLDERVPAHVFLPKGVEPPYQSVVYLPGASGFFLTTSETLSEMARLMFVPQSGRALVYPVVKGMYERRYGRLSRGVSERRQRDVWMVQDIMRTVDYIESRSDLAGGGVAFMGLSFGAEFAVPVAVEKRFRAAVLIGGALDPAWLGSSPEESAPWNFVSRITAPTLLVNGRYDFMHPYEESQVPFFEMIDVPDDQKRFVVLETGHLPPTNEVIGLALSWLDLHLGRVAR